VQTKLKRNERRLTVVSKRRDYDAARFAHVVAAYVLARLAEDSSGTEASA
jgi:hypothetical protein